MKEILRIKFLWWSYICTQLASNTLIMIYKEYLSDSILLRYFKWNTTWESLELKGLKNGYKSKFEVRKKSSILVSTLHFIKEISPCRHKTIFSELKLWTIILQSLEQHGCQVSHSKVLNNIGWSKQECNSNFKVWNIV